MGEAETWQLSELQTLLRELAEERTLREIYPGWRVVPLFWRLQDIVLAALAENLERVIRLRLGDKMRVRKGFCPFLGRFWIGADLVGHSFR